MCPRSVQDRNALVEAHSKLVREIARSIHRRLPRHFDIADLIQAGTIGLIHAAEQWEATRGVPFEAWARLKIRGAILDSIRGKKFRDELQLGVPEPVAMPSQDLDRQVDYSKLARSLDNLPPRDRKVLELRYRDGETFRKIGAELSISKKRAIDLHRRALDLVRAAFLRAA